MGVSGGVCKQFLASTCVSVAVLVVGTALGWPSPVILAIKETGQPMNMTHDDIAIMVSVIYFGNMVSPMPSGYLMDKIGRKTTLHVLTVIPIVSWILVFLASAPIYLHVARFLAGLWLGVVGTVVPMYVGEISEPKVRGAFSTFFQLMTNVGVLFAFLVGSKVDYYTLTYILGVIPICLACLLFLVPESPYWFVKKGKHHLAVRSLSWLRHKKPEQVKEELTQIEDSITREARNGKTYRDLFSSRGNRRALLMVEVLSATQRASGISALMAYTSTTLPDGVGPLSLNDCVTVMGSILAVSVFLSTFLVDKSGRKPLLVISSLGSGISMFLAGLWFFFDSNTDVDVKSLYWAPFACFISYSVFFSVGLGPLATTVQGEMFPTNIKGLASGITSIVLAFTSFVMNMIYHRIADSAGMYLNYWLFALSCFIAAVFSIFWLIETKGKSLYQIQRELNREKEDICRPL